MGLYLSGQNEDHVPVSGANKKEWQKGDQDDFLVVVRKNLVGQQGSNESTVYE